VHCGECLSQTALDRMGWKLPPEAISNPVKGVRVVFPNGSSSLVTEPGFVLEKHRFEQWLVGEAQKAGAELRLETKVLDLKRENNAWAITTSQGPILAKIIIDGSGPAAVTSRKLKLNPPVKADLPFETVTGLQYEMKDIPRDEYMDFFLWPRLAPGGYLWMIPKSGGRANVGLVTTETPKAKVFLDQFVKEKGWSGKAVVRTFGGPIPHSGPVLHSFAEGLLLVGDAAGFTSPLFEGGTQLSLRSGQFASEVAKKAVGANEFSREFLAEYEKRWKAEFPPYGKILKGKNALYGFSDEELNEMASMLPKELGNMNPTDKAAVGVQMVLKHRNLMAKGLLGAFSSFGYSRSKYYGW
jgi:digeranylgeranylglycerophospholipid reductase